MLPNTPPPGQSSKPPAPALLPALVTIDGDCRVFAQWNDATERQEALQKLRQVESSATAELEIVKERQRHLEMQFKSGTRITGPMFWGRGKLGTLIHTAQLAGRVVNGVSYSSQMDPLEQQRHRLEILLMNVRQVIEQVCSA